MLKKYTVLLPIVIALMLLYVATRHYPGGSQLTENSTGYDWKNNYLCNLFSEKAINGTINAARPWAIGGMLSLCTGFAFFFISFSKKIIFKNAARVIRYAGVSSMLFAFLIVTPLHDPMVTLSGTLALLSMFYITVFIFRSKLVWLKLFSVICLVLAYGCNYIYYSGNYLVLLPVLQKTALFFTIAWILLLQHFTVAADFEPAKNAAAAAEEPAKV